MFDAFHQKLNVEASTYRFFLNNDRLFEEMTINSVGVSYYVSIVSPSDLTSPHTAVSIAASAALNWWPLSFSDPIAAAPVPPWGWRGSVLVIYYMIVDAGFVLGSSCIKCEYMPAHVAMDSSLQAVSSKMRTWRRRAYRLMHILSNRKAGHRPRNFGMHSCLP